VIEAGETGEIKRWISCFIVSFQDYFFTCFVVRKYLKLVPFGTLPFSSAELERSGKIIGGNDLFIAAHALSLGATLMSNHTKEFTRVPEVHLEHWLSTDQSS